ncbi:Metallo-dependent phosphatase [Tilletiopsis washingtonensis]|uniref:Metallo-dependent phosphatase n=1 Tax=Tilletiopsis washingtonensis TaxID=58919 RepID=A0A316ZGI5_9BASI|nr:Metallo-dependent phosphatase [Tilletiopsis washingtonensis]PWO00878.1 Metallo-dependent phosphatase [Tilletiopsis washingtonensis]
MSDTAPPAGALSSGDAFHHTYDARSPPARPSEHHVRFVVISDTHSTEPSDVPDGDVLLHCGDLTDIGGTEAFERQIAWLRSLPHPRKIIIAGNHDHAADNSTGWYEREGYKIHEEYSQPRADPARVRQLLQDRSGGLRYLEDEALELTVDRDGVRDKCWRIYGSPWTPVFGSWAWNYERGAEHASAIPSNTDILMTHGPPHGYGGLDVVHSGANVGCEAVTQRLEAGEIRPRLHAFGHIHEARGVSRHEWSSEHSTIFANAAIADIDMGAFRERVFRYRVRHR